MSPFVASQVDSIPRAVNCRDQRVHQRGVLGDEGEDRTVVVRVAMNVEQSCVPPQRLRDGVDRRRVPPLREVRHGLEREHGRTLGA